LGQALVSDYIARVRRNPTEEDARRTKNRKTTHPRKRREGWGTRLKSDLVVIPNEVRNLFGFGCKEEEGFLATKRASE
jgi:hypothetical protein